MPDLLSSKPSYSGLHPPWECLVASRFPRYVTSQPTGQGHTHARPTMSYGSDIRKQQSLPCPKFRDIIFARIHTSYPSVLFLYPDSYALSFRLHAVPRTRPKFRARTDSASGSSRNQAHTFPNVWYPFVEQPRSLPPQYSRGVWCLPLISELRSLDYESPDDGELSDDTVSNTKRPAPIDFNGINSKSKVVDWRNDPRMTVCERERSVAPSERTGDSFVSHVHHYADGVEMGTWMLGNPNRAHADTYYH